MRKRVKSPWNCERPPHPAQDVLLSDVAKRTAGFSGADLENLMNESAILAARRNKKDRASNSSVRLMTVLDLCSFPLCVSLRGQSASPFAPTLSWDLGDRHGRGERCH